MAVIRVKTMLLDKDEAYIPDIPNKLCITVSQKPNYKPSYFWTI